MSSEPCPNAYQQDAASLSEEEIFRDSVDEACIIKALPGTKRLRVLVNNNGG